MPSFNTNKMRLYVALYKRGTPTPDGVWYHTALLLTPKEPEAKSLKQECYQYHLMNPPPTQGIITWEFRRQLVRCRPDSLSTLIYLGKVPSSITEAQIWDILAQTPLVQGDPGWVCHHWVWEGMLRLVNAGAIPALPLKPEAVWLAGMSFAEKHPAKPDMHVPTCDTSGNEIPGEIGPI